MRKSGVGRLGLSVAIVIGALFVVAFLRPHKTAGPCTVVHGPIALPDVPEASGLAIGRRDAAVLWTHNDSGHETALFALDATGALLGRVGVPVRTRDWEDISAARCPDGPCLYIADIGDNESARRQIQIYRVPEPTPKTAATPMPEVFDATYSDGPHNAEAMFVIGEDLFIVAKDRNAGVYRANAAGRGELTFRRIGQLDLKETLVTDAEASPDEQSVAVRTSHEVLVYRTADLIRGGKTPHLRIPINDLNEIQGEGVALDGDMLYLASEGWIFSRPGRLLTLHCSAPASTARQPAE
jgi:hypothetical protein